MQTLGRCHGSPRVLDGKYGGEGFDGFTAHVDDQGQVVGITVPLNREAFHVDASSGNGSAQPFVVEEVPRQRLNQGFNGFVGDAMRLDESGGWDIFVLVVHERCKWVVWLVDTPG